jgi:hypothetical protein
MARNVKIPKKIAGVKLPKQVRKKAKKAIRDGAGPIVREIAAAALGAAHARANVGRPGTRFELGGDRVAEAFRAAALNGLRSFLEGLEEGLAKAEGKSGDPQPEPRPRPKAAKKARKPKAAKPASRAPGP